MKPDGLVEVQWERARFCVCNPAGGKCEQSSQCKYCAVNSTILGGLAASVGCSMTAGFEVSLTQCEFLIRMKIPCYVKLYQTYKERRFSVLSKGDDWLLMQPGVL